MSARKPSNSVQTTQPDPESGSRNQETREPGFVFKEYDRGAQPEEVDGDYEHFYETAETQCHRPLD